LKSGTHVVQHNSCVNEWERVMHRTNTTSGPNTH
jgi:hypothetical protein